MTDEIKQAEQRGYSKGYRAGKARKQREVRYEEHRKKKAALWQRAVLAALPFAMKQTGWIRGGEPIRSIESRVLLASNVADEVVSRAIEKDRL